MADKYAQERYGYEGKAEAFVVDPDKVVLVTDKDHVLYDPRVHNKFDEAFVQKLMAEGGTPDEIALWFQRENGEPISRCIDGRQRVINSREANRRLRAASKETFNLRAIKITATPEELPWLVVTFNQHTETTLEQKIEHVVHLVERLKKPIDKVAQAFRVAPEVIKAWLKQAREAAEGEKPPQKERRVRTEKGPRMPSRKRVTVFAEKLEAAPDDDVHPQAKRVVLYLLGDKSALSGFPALQKMADEAQLLGE